MNTNNVSQMIQALDEGTFSERTQVMQEVCPCRNDVKDRDVWARVFEAAHEPGKVRVRAVHAIATLLNQAKRSARWRAVLKDLERELDAVLADPDACRLLREQVQHDPKAVGDLTPAGHTKRLRRIVALSSPEELTDWLNHLIDRDRSNGIHPGHPGLVRLWRWHQHRITMDPQRKTEPQEILAKARQWISEFFDGAEIDSSRLETTTVGYDAVSDSAGCELPDLEPMDPVLDWLESSNEKRRVRGLKKLAELGVPDLFDWCEMYLEDASVEVRIAALHAMLNCPEIDRVSIEPLADSDDVRIRAAALAVLARHEGPEWFELGLKDPSPCVRVETASVMDHLDRASHPMLYEIALHDPNPNVVRFAKRAMAT